MRGKVVCGCCGHALFRTPYKTPYYYCRYSQVSENLPCHGLRVDAAELLQAVFTTLQKQMDAVAGERKDIPAALDALQNRQDEYRQQAEALQDGKRHLYEQYLLQEIDLDTYKTKKAELDARLLRLENAYAALKVQLKQEQEARKVVRQEAEKELSTAQQMTRTLDDLLVEKVLVFPWKAN